MSSLYHIPVMLNECIEALNINPDGVYVDATYGGGGHSKKILEKLSQKGKLIAFDQDSDSIKNLPDDSRLILVNHNFSYLKNFLDYLNINNIDGILADLGISSRQIDDGTRGFSYRYNAKIDMRMDNLAEQSALDIINKYSEDRLANVFKKYSDITNANALSKAIVTYRKSKQIETIDDFIASIKQYIPSKYQSKFLSPVFQAIRIEVNDEMNALEKLLSNGAHILKKEGRFAVMSYHSVEDRIVKNFFNSGNANGVLEKDLYGNTTHNLKVVSKKPITPSEFETSENKRSRSAKLRVAIKK